MTMVVLYVLEMQYSEVRGALSANIAGDGWVLALAGDLINLVHIDNTNFGFGNIKAVSYTHL